ncbi:MAG: hypothetical protein ACYTGH_05580 [Planctomycetota bacterium]|jgi:hypothetical protein
MQGDRWFNLERGAFFLLLALMVWTGWEYFFRPPEVAVPGEPMLANVGLVGQVIQAAAPLSPPDFTVIKRDPFVPNGLLARRTVSSVIKPDQPPVVKPIPQPVDPVRPIEPVRPSTLSVVLPPKPSKGQAPVSIKKLYREKQYKLPLLVKGILEDGAGGRRLLVTPSGSGQYFSMAEGDEYKGALIREISPESVVFENELGDRYLIRLDDLRQQVGEGDDEGGATGKEDPVEPETKPGSAKKKRAGKKRGGKKKGKAAKKGSGKGLTAVLSHPVVRKVMAGTNPKDLSAGELKQLMELYQKNPELEQMAKRFMQR